MIFDTPAAIPIFKIRLKLKNMFANIASYWNPGLQGPDKCRSWKLSWFLTPNSSSSQYSITGFQKKRKLQVISWLFLRSMELAENFHGVAGPLLTPSPHLQLWVEKNSQNILWTASGIWHFSTLALTSSGASLLTSGFFSGAFIFHTTRGGVSCCTWRIQGGGDGWDDEDSFVKNANRLLSMQQQM